MHGVFKLRGARQAEHEGELHGGALYARGRARARNGQGAGAVRRIAYGQAFAQARHERENDLRDHGEIEETYHARPSKQYGKEDSNAYMVRLNL